MRLSLRARILLAMVTAGALAVAVTAIAVQVSVDSSRTMDWTVSPEQLAACEADPARWHQEVADTVSAWAYDAEGRSANPRAPALDLSKLEVPRTWRMASGDDPARRVEIKRVAEGGPCTYIQVVFRPPGDLPGALGSGMLFGAALAFLLVLGLALGFVLQPLLARIDRIRRAAEKVGTGAFTPIDDDVPDALGAIAETLGRSNTRIQANEAELRERQVALERHLAEIAHDLRTPLASLLLAVQELAPVVEPGQPAVRRALDDAEYVNALVDNLHQATVLRRGLEVGEQSRVDLREIVERLEARFAALGALRGVEVAASMPDEPVLARGVPALAERAIANLLHNAVRHGHAQGHVAVVLERVSESFELEVLDDGPGLREDQLADLRSATFSSSPVRPRDGGLGLAITLEAARRFGWTVSFEPGEPSGLRVRVRGAAG